jgi:PPM family protein phosphatase
VFSKTPQQSMHPLMQEEVSAQPLGVVGAMRSHPGCVRDLNEDFIAWVLSDSGDGPPQHFRLMALVADGMGGHAAGEVASEIAALTVLRLYNQLAGSPTEVLRDCMNAANKEIIKYGLANPGCAGMGTTCTVLAMKDDTAYIAHIGDSRAYLLRHSKLHQISEDHSLVAHLVKQGALTIEEAARSPQRGSILRALGSDDLIQPYIFREGLRLHGGDVLVLCSDGLTDVVDDPTIAHAIGELQPDEACRTLIDKALAAGGPDNISVGVFAFGGNRASQAEACATRPLQRAGPSR